MRRRHGANIQGLSGGRPGTGIGVEAPTRTAGYAPIREYAAIGDRRTAALVALDGSVDWLPLPSFSSPGVFAAMLDAERGGRFELRPEEPFRAERRYLPETNVLETTFETASGRVRVTDALALPGMPTLPWNELARRIEGDSGSVPMRWRVSPRFEWTERGEIERGPVIRHGEHSLLVQAWDAGEPRCGDGEVSGSFKIAAGRRALLALGCFDSAPLLFSERDDVEARLDETVDYWRHWIGAASHDGPWHGPVIRSALALGLLVDAQTGAMAAAPTTSLPEAIGGSRNFDYRYAWLRDTSFALDAMLQLGMATQVHGTLSWVLSATRRTHPHLRPFFTLDGDYRPGSEELPLGGYRGSSPVLHGNDAESQLQLGNYGDLFETAWHYVSDANRLDSHTALRLPEVADLVCRIWRNPDASIWELGNPQDYTQSKLSCWVALDRALKLADAGELERPETARWRTTAAEIREFIESHCWSDERRAYTRYAGTDELDASVLLAARTGYGDLPDERMDGTIAALREELGRGPLLYRYSGMQDQEGAFVVCSFWLVEALALSGRVDEASEVMDAVCALANDVGLLSEEIDPESGELLGNFPQALSHLGVINAAASIEKAPELVGQRTAG
jgi:GH15 family glucan-1,4-alpha-glucosidase